MYVKIGMEDKQNPSKGQFTVGSTKIIRHPSYIQGLGADWGNGHDVCLLEVPNLTDSQPADCDNCWSPVCLPSQHVPAGRLCYVAGWGKISTGGPTSNKVHPFDLNYELFEFFSSRTLESISLRIINAWLIAYGMSGM